MIGAEIAEALKPFALWGSVAGVVLAVVFGVLRMARKKGEREIEARHLEAAAQQREKFDAATAEFDPGAALFGDSRRVSDDNE